MARTELRVTARVSKRPTFAIERVVACQRVLPWSYDLKPERARATRHMLHDDAVERIGHARTSSPVHQISRRNEPGAPLRLDLRRTNQHALYAVARQLAAL